MEAVEAAKIFHDWAITAGVMTDAAKSVASTEAERKLVQPADETTKQILQRRQVLGVIFNNVDKEVTVLTRVAPSKKEKKSLPSRIDDIQILYRQGAVDPIEGLPSKAHGNPYVVRKIGNKGLYACGSSISQGNCRDAGTLGCLVRSVDGTFYGLSNNHVTGGCSHAPAGLPILAPGVIDVAPLGQDPFTIGYHERALDMKPGTPDNTDPSQNLDAAIFRILDEGRVTSFQGSQYDTPTATSAIAPGMDVEKVGRTTEHTRGRVIGEHFGGKPIFYEFDVHIYKSRVFYEPVYIVVGIGGAFSEPGDSGSLVTTIDAQGTRRAVGMVVGGLADKSAPGHSLTIILPIEPILQKLDVTLVGSHNV